MVKYVKYHLYYDVLEVLNTAFFYKARMDKYDVAYIMDAFEKVYASKLVPPEPHFESLDDSGVIVVKNKDNGYHPGI